MSKYRQKKKLVEVTVYKCWNLISMSQPKLWDSFVIYRAWKKTIRDGRETKGWKSKYNKYGTTRNPRAYGIGDDEI